MPSPLTLQAQPSCFKGIYTPPGDKSVSHRCVMLGALASGRSFFTHFLQAEDCLHTAHAFQAMGVGVKVDERKGTVEVQGAGLRGLKAPASELYLGNSGTSMRLIMGVLSGQRFEAVLSGDPSLSSRPMKRVTEPLKKMGAQIKGKDNGNYAPLTIRGGALKGIEYDNHLGSAQVKSALLLAGLYADGKTRIHEAVASRDHTERFLVSMGARFSKSGEWMEVEKTDTLKPLEGQVPGDISSAAFFITGAAMTPGSELTVEGVCLNPTRTGLLDVLKRMGADLEIRQTHQEPEPLGILHIRGKKLKGTRISKPEIPSLIDELPILMTAMALAEGESLVSGAEELRVKETDRIVSMTENLNLLGAQVQELPDGCVIKGVESLKPAKVRSFGDHRTVMSMCIASLGMKGALEVDDTSSVATSYPGFFSDFQRLKTGA
ncbi:MAG TPA: 3-phosphoshikimate 1-carboxyvinyltransferase [Verrucomicrobiae bacterium]|jgi:3-phosphoshikimate 1-carboxyvinyltransferase|nr:3-phosphoshikimate 1-carboxyvinyltransferase [Verrucomicrobiae bacterium]